MEHVRPPGFPVPAVEDVSDDGLEMVMERIEGANMVATMAKQPWAIRRQGRVLADLHLRLHGLAAPDWLDDAPVGGGDRLLHLDLHPLNVMIGRDGPVVIDWARACRGDPNVDVALAWVLIAAGEVPTGLLTGMLIGRARSSLLKSFVSRFDMAATRELLREVVAWKVQDPHMSGSEQGRMWAVVREACGDMPQ